MFACPHCAKELQPQRGPQGVVYLCPLCHGHAASLAVLRRVFGAERVAVIVGDSFRSDAERGCACPVCQGGTVRVNWIQDDAAIVLDLCRRCEFAWFDPNEYESITPAPPSPHVLGQIDESALSDDDRETLALERARQLSRDATRMDAEPDRDWKTIPALFGLPVELDSASATRVPIATCALSGLIAAISLSAFLWAHLGRQNVAAQFGLVPAQWGRDFGLTLVSSFFLHGGLAHLVSNLYFLLIFGGPVEAFLGSRRWLVLIAAAALLGDALDVALTAHSTLPLIGASGGISGLLAFYALKFPHARLGMMFYFRWFEVPSWAAFVFWIALQVFGAYQQLPRVGHVASLAHLGGVAAGVGAWLLWRNLDARPASTASPVLVTVIR